MSSGLVSAFIKCTVGFTGKIGNQDYATVGERMKSRQTSEKQALTPYSSMDKTFKYCKYVWMHI